MKIIIAPNAFKGSLTQIQAINAIRAGIRDIITNNITLIELPMADGGDGLLLTLKKTLNAQSVHLFCHGPLGTQINTHYLHLPKSQQAIIELSLCSGLTLIKPEQYNPLLTSTYGLGEIINDALTKNVKKIIIGIGGSATHDVGMGMATALGFQFYDKKQQPLIANGSNLINVHKIDTKQKNPALDKTTIEVICDVNNPLLGEQGAAKVYAHQKGADETMIFQLEQGTKNFVNQLEEQFNIEVRHLKGSGAAGGLGAGLVALLNARLLPGSETVLHLLNFDEHLKAADLIITGEGCIDQQTSHNKIPAVIAQKAQLANVPCIGIAGSVESNCEIPFTATYSLSQNKHDLQASMNNAAFLLRQTTRHAIREYLNSVARGV